MTLLTGITIAVVIGQLFHMYYYGEGNLQMAYPIAVLVFAGFMITETMLALRDPAQWSIILFNICNLWGFVNAVRGCIRIRRDRQNG